MIIKEIIQKYLEDNEYDGLCNKDCWCHVDDLQPCDEDFSSCSPGHYKMDENGEVVSICECTSTKGKE